MKRQLSAAALALGAFAFASALTVRPVCAQAVYCTNCASEITQLLNLARLVDQLGTQGNILQTNTNQFQTMTVNTTPLPSLQWGNGPSDLQSVTSLLAGVNALSFANTGLTGHSAKLWHLRQLSHRACGEFGFRGQVPAMVHQHQCERALDAGSRIASVRPNQRRRTRNPHRLEEPSRRGARQFAGAADAGSAGRFERRAAAKAPPAHPDGHISSRQLDPDAS